MVQAKYEELVQLSPLNGRNRSDTTTTNTTGHVEEDEHGHDEDVSLLRGEEGWATRASSFVRGLSWRDPATVLGSLCLAIFLVIAIETLVTTLLSTSTRDRARESDALLSSNLQRGVREDYQGRPRVIRSTVGAVASDQGDCSEIGKAVLNEGGHAVDAAVATALCLGVKNPFASGIGGGAFILIRLSNGTTEAIDSREVAPENAEEEMFVEDPHLALEGGLAVAIPMEVLGLHQAWRKHGKKPWKDLVMPAAVLARDGFEAHPYLIKSVKSHLDAIQKHTALGEIFLKPDGSVPKVGELCCKRPQLAKTLEEIALKGPRVLYSGNLAKGLVEDVKRAGGIMTEQDLQRAEPRYLDVLEAHVMGGLKLLTFPPPSSGSVAVSILKQVEARRIPVATSGALGKHWLIEAMKNSFAVRMSLGDPGSKEEPYLDLKSLGSIVEDLISSEYAESLVRDTLDNSTRPQMEYGGIHRSMYLPDDNGTSHLSIVDSDQNAVSMTTTINTGFGSKIVSESTGILLNNEMDDFSIPGAPNTYGLAPSESNFIRPGKKPLSSMSPSMLVDAKGSLKMVVGASGGPMIITAVAQTILNYFDLGLDPLSAVQSPRVHHQLFPNAAKVENYSLHDWMEHEGEITFEEHFLAALRKFGHTLRLRNSGLGNCQMIVYECEEGREEEEEEEGKERNVDGACKTAVAVSDARKDGAPA